MRRYLGSSPRSSARTSCAASPAAPRTRQRRLHALALARLRRRAHRHARQRDRCNCASKACPATCAQPRGLTAGAARAACAGANGEIGDALVRPQRDSLSTLLTLRSRLAARRIAAAKGGQDEHGRLDRTAHAVPRRAARRRRRADRLRRSSSARRPGKLVLRHCLARKLHEPLEPSEARLSRAASRVVHRATARTRSKRELFARRRGDASPISIAWLVRARVG